MKLPPGFGLVLKLAVSFGLLALLATRIDFGRLAGQVVAADRGRLVLAAVLFLTSNLLGAVQWGTLLRASGLDVKLPRILVYYFQGSFFGLFLPASVGADVSRIYDTTRHTGQLGGSLAATIMDRLVGLYSIGSMAVLALLLRQGALPPPTITVPIFGFAAMNLFIAALLFSRRASAALERRSGRLPERPAGVARLIITSVHGLGRRPGLLGPIFLLSILVQVLRIFVHYHVALALGIQLALTDYFVIVPILAVLVALPISFGGLGVREAAAVELFGHVGLSPAESVGMQLTTFLLAIVVNLPGWFFFVIRQLRGRDATAADAGAAGELGPGARSGGSG